MAEFPCQKHFVSHLMVIALNGEIAVDGETGETVEDKRAALWVADRWCCGISVF